MLSEEYKRQVKERARSILHTYLPRDRSMYKAIRYIMKADVDWWFWH